MQQNTLTIKEEKTWFQNLEVSYEAEALAAQGSFDTVTTRLSLENKRFRANLDRVTASEQDNLRVRDSVSKELYANIDGFLTMRDD